MKFLVDQNRSPLIAQALRNAGHDAIHTFEIGLERALDVTLFELAAREQRIIVSADTDFATLLAEAGSTAPSVILFRVRHVRRAADQAALLLANLDDIANDLEAGAIVVIRDDRLRIRLLPIRRDKGE